MSRLRGADFATTDNGRSLTAEEVLVATEVVLRQPDAHELLLMLGLVEQVKVKGRKRGGRTHGTTTTYKWGCRCEPCREAKRSYDRMKRAQYAAARPPKPKPQHGTPSMYTNHGCRCAPCTEANRLQCLYYRDTRAVRLAAV